MAAKALFAELNQMNITYQQDPNIPYYQDDRVQFADETLSLRTGDCDDLVVLYASLLESVGIRTAFVDVRDPDKEITHVFLLLDTGVESANQSLISANPKRLVLRGRSPLFKTTWIPIESTLLKQGFEQAGLPAATSYLQDVALRNGLRDGWVIIVDVE